MYRLLIVDDETIVRRGIKKSVNWNELGIEMVAEAADGVEALSQVMENQPDIILLDINMPKMDGLEFASIIKKQYPQIKIVIITGYHEFEYARSALRAGVNDYIVKPITKEDVGGIIRAQLEKIKAEREDKSGQYIVTEQSVKHTLLNAILKKKQLIDKDIHDFCKLMKWNGEQRVSFVLIRNYLSDCAIWNDGQTDSLAEFAILNIANEVLEMQDCGLAFQTYKNELALLLNCPQKEIVRVLNEIYGNLLDFLEIPVDFAVSQTGTLKELPELEDQARVALNCAFVLSHQNILFYGDVTKRQDKSIGYPEQMEMELLETMFTGEHAQSLELIDGFFEQLAQATPDVAKCKNMLLRLFLKVENTLESISSRTNYASDKNAPEPFDALAKVESFKTLEEAREWLKRLYTETYNYVTGIKSRTGQLYLKLKAYIEKNYGDSELNLKKCSEDLFLSPSYISMILKKEAGRTFVDYLNEYRIKRAEELLARPENMIYEVSIQVGFTHPTYFSSVFKKLVGVSPKQYKENSRL